MSEASSSSSNSGGADAAVPALSTAATSSSSSQTKIAQKTWEMSNSIMEVICCFIVSLGAHKTHEGLVYTLEYIYCLGIGIFLL
jgi:hypothetical protein